MFTNQAKNLHIARQSSLDTDPIAVEISQSSTSDSDMQDVKNEWEEAKRVEHGAVKGLSFHLPVEYVHRLIHDSRAQAGIQEGSKHALTRSQPSQSIIHAQPSNQSVSVDGLKHRQDQNQDVGGVAQPFGLHCRCQMSRD